MKKRISPRNSNPKHGIPRTRPFFVLLYISFLLQSFASSVMSLQSFNYTDLQPCTLSTHELSQLGRDDDGLFEPCILDHVMPASDHQNTAVVTMVQVTPAECSHHRDGAYVAVRKMNADHDGKGIQIGFYGNHSVRDHDG